jgi:YVTN family beta-propeller protein
MADGGTVGSTKAAFSAAGFLAGLAMSLTACAGPEPPPASALPLTQVQDIVLPGAASRLDYQALDAGSKRLYIAHLGDGTVHAVDLDHGTVAGTVSGTPSVHGVTFGPGRHLLLAAVSGTNEVALINTDTLTVTARVPAGDTPDGIAYDPVHGKAYVSNEHDHAETVIDLATNTARAPIEIGGEAGNSVYDPASGTVMVNVQDRNELVTIDPATDAVTGRIPVPDCSSNHGLYVDAAHRLSFIACEGSAKLLVLDLETKQVTARFSTGDGPDVLAFDEGLQRLYVASESGVVSVFDEQNGTLVPRASGKLADHAHTVAVDQATHRVYFPLESVNGKPVLRVMDAKPSA